MTGNGKHIYHLYIYGDDLGDGKHDIVLPTLQLIYGTWHVITLRNIYWLVILNIFYFPGYKG